MKPDVLFAEAARTAWAQKVPSALTMIVLAIMCFTALATVGRARANDNEMAASLDTAGARILKVSDSSRLNIISPAMLGVVEGMEGVETVVALSSPVDVHAGGVQGGSLIPLWEVSNAEAISNPVIGNLPLGGQGTVTSEVQKKLGLVQPSGYVEGRYQVQLPLVSQSRIRPGFEDLGSGVIVQADEETTYTQLRVIVASVEQVPGVQRAVLSMFGPVDPSKLSVESPRAMNTISEMLQNQLGRYNQSMLGLILGIGAVFIAIVVLSDVLLHRNELGRRRALGATRKDLSLLTVARTIVPAAVGAVIGSVSVLILFHLQGVNIPTDLATAIGWLAIVTVGLVALIPAIWASARDPVTVLRTP